MLRIIGNMSDAGSYAAPVSTMETMDIPGFFREIFEKLQPTIAHTGLSLHFDNLDQPLYCLADREKLERAVMNIISNAMKFTPAGGTIAASLKRRENRLYLSVQDSGEGIPDNIRSSIHHRFLRQPGLEDSRFGIGLGMVLIRSAAAIHGGTVLIDQPQGTGTRITMTMAIRQNTSGDVRSPLLRIDYAGERDHSLIELADILPAHLYVVNVIKLRKLSVKRRSRKRDLIFVIIKVLKLIVRSLLCLIRTKSDALTAIDTLFFLYYRVSIANSYRLGRTSFYAIGTAFTFR